MKKTLAILLAVLPAIALAGRNTSGTYSLPAGTPFVSGTSISSSVMNNVQGDLATEITNSLDRQGRGGMLAPVRTPDGSVSAPAQSFTNETGTGLYRIGSSDLGISINGTKRAEVTATGITRASLQPVGQQVSSSSGSFSTGSGTPVAVTNLTLALTTTGRPVVIALQPAGAAPSTLGITGAGGAYAYVYLRRDGATIAAWAVNAMVTPSLYYLDAGASAAAHTYDVQTMVNGGIGTMTVNDLSLAAHEL